VISDSFSSQFGVQQNPGAREPEHHYHNEVMTDITAIFLGLGKLMLNGAESKRVRHEIRDNNSVEVTESRKVGYLDRRQMAFVYRLVCSMRRIPATVYERGLTPQALDSVRNVEAFYSYSFFDARFHSDKTIEKSLQALNEDVNQIRDDLDGLDSDLRDFQKRTIQPITKFLASANEEITILTHKTRTTSQKEEYDPAQRFLHRVQLQWEIDRSKQDIANFHTEVKKHRKTVAGLLETEANGGVVDSRYSRAPGFCWTPNCDENESEITRRCV